MKALPPRPIESIPQNDSYDPYHHVFGNVRQEVLQNMRYFMIGAGMRDREQLKNWSVMELP
jgi:hypothetical protein